MRSAVIACLVVSLSALVLLPGCGSSSTENELGGRWWGPALEGGSRGIEILGGGRVLAYEKDGNPTGAQGWIKHIAGAKWDVYFDSGAEGLFMLGPTGNHAALLVPGDDLCVLQRGATNWSEEDFVLEDLAGKDYEGIAWLVNNSGYFLDAADCTVSIAADGSYEGEDSRGRIFANTAAGEINVVDVIQGAYYGGYGDQFRPTGGEITVLMTPDKQFVCAQIGWAPFGWKDGWIATWSER